MTSHGRTTRALAGATWIALGAGLATLVACAKLVGIVDTDVTRGDDGQDGSPSEASVGRGPGDAAQGGDDATSPVGPESGAEDSPTADATQGDATGSSAMDSSAIDATAGDASAGGACGSCPINRPTCAAGQCTVRGPTMVQVGAFYIDSTEVTADQYQQFLTAKGSDTSGQPGVCAWNTSYSNSASLNPGTWPMTGVDWCDAYAFCAWAGKHLCGAIGGGSLSRADALTASKSQWFLSCGGPGGSSDVNADPVCNASFGTGDLAPVASYPKCEGYYSGLFDMTGNAAEWVDSCDSTDAGATDVCHLLGGSYQDETSYCTEAYDSPRNDAAYPYGFRCCGG